MKRELLTVLMTCCLLSSVATARQGVPKIMSLSYITENLETALRRDMVPFDKMCNRRPIEPGAMGRAEWDALPGFKLVFEAASLKAHNRYAGTGMYIRYNTAVSRRFDSMGDPYIELRLVRPVKIRRPDNMSWRDL